jgi:hypothetical protein
MHSFTRLCVTNTVEEAILNERESNNYIKYKKAYVHICIPLLQAYGSMNFVIKL